MRDGAIGFLLRRAAEPAPCADVAAWWSRHAEAARVWRNPMDLAIAGGGGADRVGWAFATGYQAALHALFPGMPEDRICALCVTEAEGNTPRAIRSTLRPAAGGWVLDGEKRWTTLGPGGALFLVAAREPAAPGERAAIRIAKVASAAQGVTVQAMPPTRFVPEVPHAQLRFDGVAIEADALLPGDGYETGVKPFRTVEDLHVTAAIIAYLVREARRLDWPAAWIERAAALLHALRALAAEDPAHPATHVALAGALAQSSSLLDDADALWARTAQDLAAPRWARDRALLGIAASARAMRTQRAWERLA